MNPTFFRNLSNQYPISDYLWTKFSPLKFSKSGVQDIQIIIVNDDVIEDNESFSVVLRNPLPDTMIINDTVTVTIIDDDEREF